MSTLLEVSHLRVAYADVQALWDVSLEIEQGQIVALVGANGAGKTTTLRAISGVVRILGGSILLDGEDLARLASHEIVDSGVVHVPEGRQLWPGMSVQETLELGAYPARARARREETLHEVYGLFPRLQERQKQAADTMSGGEQQMCAIARGLMARPRLLMLDEPSLGLSPIMLGEVFDTVKRIAAEGVTVLLVEQNVEQALALADRAYVLETGSVVLSGTGQELLGNDAVRRTYLGVA
ncbi:MAG TPA: ABC transporter ATP-binding protein [Chloroflexota bacterium]|nr:ABC transporter ATP-binding protein [Chloroflexota bacterium]